MWRWESMISIVALLGVESAAAAVVIVDGRW